MQHSAMFLVTMPRVNQSSLMTSEILSVLIDERRQLDSLNDLAMIGAGGGKFPACGSGNRVFKDYLLSSEVFYVDQSMN